jgi:hypothetical protein
MLNSGRHPERPRIPSVLKRVVIRVNSVYVAKA